MNDADLVTAMCLEREFVNKALASAQEEPENVLACVLALKLRWEKIDSLLETACKRLCPGPPVPWRLEALTYPELCQMRDEAKRRVRERTVIRNKITHSRVRAAWDKAEGPHQFRDEAIVAALVDEIEARRAEVDSRLQPGGDDA